MLGPMAGCTDLPKKGSLMVQFSQKLDCLMGLQQMEETIRVAKVQTSPSRQSGPACIGAPENVHVLSPSLRRGWFEWNGKEWVKPLACSFCSCVRRALFFIILLSFFCGGGGGLFLFFFFCLLGSGSCSSSVHFAKEC